MISRRGFIGTVLAAPLAAPIVTSAFEQLPIRRTSPPNTTETAFAVDGGAKRFVTARQYARAVFFWLNQSLRDYPLDVVGPVDARLGTEWGSGAAFSHNVCVFLREMTSSWSEKKGHGFAYDRLLARSIGEQMATEIRKRRIRYVGRMPQPHGLLDAEYYENRRLWLRFVTVYEVATDCVIGRFDVLGATA